MLKASIFYLLMLLILSTQAQLVKNDPIHVSSSEEAQILTKILTIELQLDKTQQSIIEKTLTNYAIRTKSAQTELSNDTIEMNLRLKQHVEHRDVAILRTLGEKKSAAFTELLSVLNRKMVEFKKKANIN